jgi:hypothetical protein
LYTMGDIARCSVGKENEFHNEELLYKLFGVNAEFPTSAYSARNVSVRLAVLLLLSQTVR